MARTGRKQKPHICSWDGKAVPGLYHCPDGRWRIVSTGVRFSQPDERLAVAYFRRLEARQHGHNASIELPIPADDPVDDTAGAVEFVVRHELGPGEHFSRTDDALVLRIPKNPDEQWTMLRQIPVDAMAAFLKHELLDRPKFWAEQTGIEQLGYWADLQKPVPSPTLDEVGNFFFAKKKLSKNWTDKSRVFWTEFVDFMAVTKLREVTQEKVLDYADAIIDAPHGPTYSRQRFQAVKALLNYPQKRAKWTDDCNRVHGYCKVLIPSKKSRVKPTPIDRADFHKLLKVADAEMTAVLLTMLNFSMYAGEAAALQWNNVDLTEKTLNTVRNKTDVIRIGVAWTRTVEAIQALPRTTANIFLNDIGTSHSYLTIYRAFRKLRTAANVPDVQLSQVRDGAYTAAVAAGVPIHQAKLLAGHSTGISDAYVQRQPKMVADACAAIERAYFG